MSSISCRASVCARTPTASSRRRREQVKLNATLTLRREQYKDKTSTIRPEGACQREETIKDLESYRDRLRGGKPCPLCGACEHPAIEQYASLTLTIISAAAMRWKRSVAALKEEGLLIRQVKRPDATASAGDTEAAGRLAEEEQALLKRGRRPATFAHRAGYCARDKRLMQEQSATSAALSAQPAPDVAESA